MKREIQEIRRGFDGTDGAGVKLVRVLSAATVKTVDPFLMLDIFDSDNYEDYIKGFPMHPHRGMETITYLLAGSMEHEDSLGNKGMILPGGTQWMTAGSGILHQEMPQKSDHMMGFQLWLNLSAENKMKQPAYREVNEENMPKVIQEGQEVRVISGSYQGTRGGVTADYIKPEIYVVKIEKDHDFELNVPKNDTCFFYIYRGVLNVEGTRIDQKNGVVLGPGEEVKLSALEESLFMFISAPKLGEPVAWGGPIVMNTREELQLAFQELEDGTFIKDHDVAGTQTLNQ